MSSKLLVKIPELPFNQGGIQAQCHSARRYWAPDQQFLSLFKSFQAKKALKRNDLERLEIKDFLHHQP